MGQDGAANGVDVPVRYPIEDYGVRGQPSDSTVSIKWMTRFYRDIGGPVFGTMIVGSLWTIATSHRFEISTQGGRRITRWCSRRGRGG